MTELKIMVEISLDGPRMLQKPRPADWDTWTNEAREAFINDMQQDLINWSVAFTVTDDGGR